jgi:hypothetical protein
VMFPDNPSTSFPDMRASQIDLYKL